MRLSVVLIVKNEEALLARCLESVKEADEIVICDTGSTDRTIEVARRYTDRIFTDYIWADDFAAARNHALSKATGDWVLTIDADEILLSPFSEVRAAANLAFMAANVLMTAEGQPDQQHWFPKLFKRSSQVYWIGAIHNHLSVLGEDLTGVRVHIEYGYSPAHAQDRNRTLRILEREVASRKDAVRETFYLGREYYYRAVYDKAVIMLGRYVQQSSSLNEKADAFLIMSRAFWAMRQADDARDACVQALICNPHFKEACLFMATLAGDGTNNPRWQRNADQWKRMAETADNGGILFIRTEAAPTTLLLSPHDDDAALFAAFTCLREHPGIVVVMDSWTQPLRGELGCSAEERAAESAAAHAIMGCRTTRLGLRDTEDLTYEQIVEALRRLPLVERIYAPATESDGGHQHHNLVGRAAAEVFGPERLRCYSTYNRTSLAARGDCEIIPTKEERALKAQALLCYKSQLRINRQHFDAVAQTSEWLSPYVAYALD